MKNNLYGVHVNRVTLQCRLVLKVRCVTHHDSSSVLFLGVAKLSELFQSKPFEGSCTYHAVTHPVTANLNQARTAPYILARTYRFLKEKRISR